MKWSNVIYSFKHLGVGIHDTQELRLKKLTVLIISVSCCIAAPIWSAIYFMVGQFVPAFGPIFYLCTVVPAIVYFLKTKNIGLLMNVQIAAIFFCPVFMQWTAGGFTTGGVVILWSFLAPLSALLFFDAVKARTWMAMVIACIIITVIFDGFFRRFGISIDQTSYLLLTSMNLLGPSLAIYFSMQYFLRKLQENSKMLLEEKQKSDTLLLNILPAKVAEELKIAGKTVPMKYAASTVIFSDFIDFTKISEELTPEQLIEELDTCFRSFDDIVSSFGLEKIKTIGDAYMCVAGIPEETEGSAVRAVAAALKMAEYINMRSRQRSREGKPYWSVRIGAHTGDVVAGIVGKHKFAYDIWGDTVNTANRMETCGEAGKVNISGVTYELVKNNFSCSYRGKIHAKNKGEIDMYFVE